MRRLAISILLSTIASHSIASVPSRAPLIPASTSETTALRQVRLVALSSTPAPGTALNFGNAFDTRDFYLSPAGDVVFGSLLSGQIFDYGFWRWTAGTPPVTSLIARHGGSAEGTDGFYNFADGQSRFMALSQENVHGMVSSLIGGERSLWVGSGNLLNFLTGQNSPAPQITDGLFANLPQSLTTRPVFNGSGVTFIATLKDGPAMGSSVNSDNDSGIWIDDGSGLRLVTRENSDMPGLPGQKFANFGRPVMTPFGDVWFTANAKLPASNDGLFHAPHGGGLELKYQRSDYGTISKVTVSPTNELQFIATISSPPVTQLISEEPIFGPQSLATIDTMLAVHPSPDRDGKPTGSPFVEFLHHLLPRAGRPVLLARTKDNWRGIWRSDAGIFHLIVRNGDPAPGVSGSQTFLSITQMVAGEDGVVAFEATTSGNGTNTGWWRIGDDGNVKPLIVPGDHIEVSPAVLRTVTTVKGPLVNGASPAELGVGWDGVPTHMNRENILLQVTLNNFTSTALVLAGVSDAFVVNSTGDDVDLDPGDGLCDTGGTIDGATECTLRAAIMESNALAGPNTIRFDIPEDDPGYDGTTGWWTIHTPQTVPDVADGAAIDATTQPGYNSFPKIVLDGTGTTLDEQSGIRLTGGSSTVAGLCVVRFSGHAIAIEGGSGHRVRACFLGVLPSGLTAPGNGRSGVDIRDTPGNLIGGTGEADRNVIAGNDLNGGTSGVNVAIGGIQSTANVISANFIGVGSDGLTRLGGQTGIELLNAPFNRIGGTTDGERNVVSGNVTGIEIEGVEARENIVIGNFVGVAADGQTPAANSRAGIRITESTDNVIGGLTDGIGQPPGNVISGNDSNQPDAHGLVLVRAHRTAILGNLIGTGATGLLAVPNGGDGIRSIESDSLQIGTMDERGINVISGNDSSGVVIELGRGHRIHSNVIGLRRDLSGAVPNLKNGVHLENTPGNEIASNLVGGNGRHGILIQGSDADSTRLLRNVIGTEPASGSDYGNGGDGIRIEAFDEPSGPGATMIGDGTPVNGNTVHFNGESGVRILSGPTRVRGGSFYRNEDLGIELLGPGVTPNDKGDPDLGPNGLLNFPVLTRAGVDTMAATIRIRGAMGTKPSTSITIDFFGSPECDPEGYGEGRDLLGSLDVMTGADSLAPIDVVFPLAGGPAAWPAFLTATATSAAGTSEFSACVEVEIPDKGLTALVINSTGDASDLNPGDGVCSTGGTVGGEAECTLRAALEEAGALPGFQSLFFDIQGAAPFFLIRPASPLPAAIDVDIDATTQPGYATRPIVSIEGSLLSSGPALSLSGSAVSGLGIFRSPGDGLLLGGAGGNAVGFCDVGIQPSTGAAAPNGRDGIRVESGNNRIGGPNASRPNRIAHNAGDGIHVASGVNNEISGNELFENGGLGIDLAGGSESDRGVTANDPGDADDGPNHLVNRPVLDNTPGNFPTILGSYSGTPDQTFRLEFFFNPDCDSAGAGEGSNYVGSMTITTDGTGVAMYEAMVENFPFPDADGVDFFTVTATDANGNTSEFSDCLLLPTVPVKLLSFESSSESGRARLAWTVADDGSLLGFRVWRRPAPIKGLAEAGWVLRTTGLLAGIRDEIAATSVRFAFEDPLDEETPDIEYRLEAVSRDGASEFLGPFALSSSPPAGASISVAPNPFLGRTQVYFELPVAGPLRVNVFDVNGRLMRTLSDGPRPAGRHAAAWDGRDDGGHSLPAGLYFIRMESPAGRRVARVLLLR